MPKKNSKKRAPKSKPLRKVGDPVFNYTSLCCSARAMKQPLVMPTDKAVGGFGAAPEEREGTLGSWRCSNCGKTCKCSRTKAGKLLAEVE